MTQPELSLVLGGARSGKSRWAETLALQYGRPCTYLATAEALDAEMAARIAAHRDRRGPEWQLVVAPLNLPEALAAITPETLVLVDCLTLWLSNLMMGGHNLDTATQRLLAALDARTGPVILVSNEVGLGLVPETPLGREFRDAQGLMNQRVAALAGRVVLVVAGLALALKGRVP